MAWKLNILPWQMLDLTPPELEALVRDAKELAKEPRG